MNNFKKSVISGSAASVKCSTPSKVKVTINEGTGLR